MDFVYIMVLFIDSKMLLCFKLALSPSPMEFSGVHVNLKVLYFLIDACILDQRKKMLGL